MQSHVVDINTDDVSVYLDFTPLEIDYALNHCRTLCKTQEGWKIVPGTRDVQLLHGPLVHPHRLYEIHGHMVGDSCLESCRRHSVDGKEYAGELHLLHYDILKNFSPNKLNVPLPDHKAIICLLLEEGNINNELSKLTTGLPELRYRDKKMGLDDDVDPTSLLPENLEFWMYKEDTLVENQEKTTWIIFKKPIEVSKEQVNAMRSPCERANATGSAIQPQIERIISEGHAVFKPSVSQ